MLRVGWLFYKNGEIFLTNLIPNNIQMVRNVNNLLLIGYYLVNLGYAVLTISNWKLIESSIEAINTLTSTIGKIILILAILHYNNVLWLNYLTKHKILN
jgi:hypothetical protein